MCHHLDLLCRKPGLGWGGLSDCPSFWAVTFSPDTTEAAIHTEINEDPCYPAFKASACSQSHALGLILIRAEQTGRLFLWTENFQPRNRASLFWCHLTTCCLGSISCIEMKDKENSKVLMEFLSPLLRKPEKNRTNKAVSVLSVSITQITLLKLKSFWNIINCRKSDLVLNMIMYKLLPWRKFPKGKQKYDLS